MSLHPDLAALVRGWDAEVIVTGEDQSISYIASPAQLTAFALAVARAERERCANWLCRTIPPLYDLAGAMIDGLPDPAWAAPTP